MQLQKQKINSDAAELTYSDRLALPGEIYYIAGRYPLLVLERSCCQENVTLPAGIAQ